jgi:hypothetical protein
VAEGAVWCGSLVGWNVVHDILNDAPLSFREDSEKVWAEQHRGAWAEGRGAWAEQCGDRVGAAAVAN